MTERNSASETPMIPDPLIGRTLDDRYRVLSLLAQGGMGRVYKAEQTSLGRIVAIKTLALTAAQSNSDPQFQQRFALEAAATSRLKNPHTVTIFDYGRTHDGLFYIVMEYVEGATLAQALRREGRFSCLRAIGLIRQICIALREAHRHGIIHRDIKPANLLILQDGYEHLKVLDFGIAKMLHKEFDGSTEQLEITRSGTFLGTPEYMAPEAMTGRADIRSDIYSVGVVFFLMLTGRLPFKATSPADTIMMVMQDPIPYMDPGLGIPEELEQFVRKCLARRSDERFQSIDELMSELAPISAALGMELPITSPTLNAEVELDGSMLLPEESLPIQPPLPHWLRNRQQQLAMVASAAAVVLIGLILLIFRGPEGSKAVTSEPRITEQAVVPAEVPTSQTGSPGREPTSKDTSAHEPASGASKAGVAVPQASPSSAGSSPQLDAAGINHLQPAAPQTPTTSGTVDGRSIPDTGSATVSPSNAHSERKSPPKTRSNTRPRSGTSSDGGEGVPDGYKPSPY